MKFFSSSSLVLGLGLFAAANPVPSESRDNAIARRDTVPNAAVFSLTLFSVFQILSVAVKAITPGLTAIAAGEGPQGQAGEVAPLVETLVIALSNTQQLASLPAGDMGGADADIANLVEEILDVRTTLRGTSKSVVASVYERLRCSYHLPLSFEEAADNLILRDVNTALNGLVPKLGLDGFLTPLDAALTDLPTTLRGILPPVLALVGAILIPVGGLVGSLMMNVLRMPVNT